jgi:hypothetical protein
LASFVYKPVQFEPAAGPFKGSSGGSV